MFKPRLFSAVIAAMLAFTALPVHAETNPPIVSAVSPTSATVGVMVTLSATFNDMGGSWVAQCQFTDGGVNTLGTSAFLAANSGTASIDYTFMSAGSHNVQAQCVDLDGNWGYGAVTAVTVSAGGADTTPPTVSAPSPSSATVGSAITFSTTYSDAGSGAVQCRFMEGEVVLAVQSFDPSSSGTATAGYTFTSAGTHNIQARCVDVSSNWGYSVVTGVTVASAPAGDTTDPTVGAVSPTTATVGTAVMLSATYNDMGGSGVTRCEFIEGGGLLAGVSFSATNAGTASVNYTFSSAGTHSVQAQCSDASFNWGNGAMTTVTVSAAAADTTAPSVGGVTYSSTPYIGSTVTISASYSDAGSGVSYCYINGDGARQAPDMTIGSAGSGTASRTMAFMTGGTHSVYIVCVDAAGNVGTGPTNTFVATSAPSGGDATPPTVGMIVQTSAIVGVGTTLSASVSDNVGVNRCDLYVNGSNVGSMSLSGGTASRSYSFSGTGNATAYAACYDAAGNSGTSALRTIAVVSGGGTPPPATSGSLVKLACPSFPDVNHPCKAVYYFGADGKRHAFPNEKIYFTWFTNFDGVVTVSDSAIAAMPLGANVTYRPGVRMVKFTTVPSVYAVTRRGVLRWVGTESLAIGLYGSTWNTQIDDISDAFYANYSFGGNISSTSDYSPSAERAAVTSIDQNL